MSGFGSRVVGAGLVAALLGTTALAYGAAPALPVAGNSAAGLAASAPVLPAAWPALRLAQTAVDAAASFTWSATKAADGSVTFEGSVPSQEVRETLADGIGSVAADHTGIAAGAPDGFAADAVAALDVLGDLDSGRVGLDGDSWTIAGMVDSPDKAAAAQADFDASPLKTLDAGYTVTVSGSAASAAAGQGAAGSAGQGASAAGPTAAAAPDVTVLPPATPGKVPPVVAPNYAWSAEKAGDGTITFNGTVPTGALKATLRQHAGPGLLDNSTVDAGAPEDFAAGAEHGLDALMALESGKLLFAAGSWSLAGIASDRAGEAAAHAALAGIDTGNWRFDIKAPVKAATAATPPAVTDTPAAGGTADSGATADAATPAEAAQPDEPAEPADAGPSAAEPSTSTETPPVAAPAPAKATEMPPAPDSEASTAASPAESPAPEAATTTPTPVPSAAEKTTPAPTTPEPAAPAEPAAPSAPAPAATPPENTAAPAAEAPAPSATTAAPYVFDATKSDTGAVALSGAVPTEGARGYFSDVAGAASAELQVQPNPPENFIIAALGGIEALGQLSSGHLAHDGKGWSLTGKAATPEIRQQVLAKIAALPAGADWTTDVAGPAPIELCRESLATFASTSAINFDSRTRLSKGSDAELDTLAAALSACPDVRVDVEGFTDSDGDADSNLALSVARAETVIDELVKRGIRADRLYAVGYGETLPLVPNTSQANKAKNRRIEFKLQAGDAK